MNPVSVFLWLTSRPALYNTAGKYNIVFSAPDQTEQTVSVVVQMPLASWYEAFWHTRGWIE